jgi:NAD(P)-dependent dehydrogenase (short-subunit alcohol dehydrogenase family)
MDKKVWFITGASKGLGLSLIKQLLATGHRVAAASKHLPELVETISKTPDAGFLPLEFDAADEAAVAASISATRETFGRLDIVVNNAGYGAADPRETAAVTVATLAWLRTQGSGHIIYVNPPQLPAQPTRHPDVHITTVVTGPSHTLPTTTQDPASTMTIPIDGKQIGDPQKAAAALMTIAALPKPPNRLFLATNAGNLAAVRMAELHETIKYLEARLNRQALNCRIRPAQLSPLQ